MSGQKPSESSSSASSSTTTRTAANEIRPAFRWSSMRPGVPTSTCTPARSASSCGPVADAAVDREGAHPEVAAHRLDLAAHLMRQLAGRRHHQRLGLGPRRVDRRAGSGCRRRRSCPLPVRAWTIRSLPRCISGTTRACTGIGSFQPRSRIPARRLSGRSSKETSCASDTEARSLGPGGRARNGGLQSRAMSRIGRAEVERIGHLARLRLEPDEADALARDLDAILGHVAELEALDTSGTPARLREPGPGDASARGPGRRLAPPGAGARQRAGLRRQRLPRAAGARGRGRGLADGRAARHRPGAAPRPRRRRGDERGARGASARARRGPRAAPGRVRRAARRGGPPRGGGERRAPRPRAGALAPRRHPDRAEGQHRPGGRALRLRLAHPRRLRLALRRNRGRAPARGRRDRRRAHQHGRVRDGLLDGALVPRPDAEPLGPRALAGRLLGRLGGGRGRGHRPARLRQRHRRLDPPARGLHRRRRAEAQLRPRLALRPRRLRELPRPDRPPRAHRRGLRRRPRRRERPRPARLDLAARAADALPRGAGRRRRGPRRRAAPRVPGGRGLRPRGVPRGGGGRPRAREGRRHAARGLAAPHPVRGRHLLPDLHRRGVEQPRALRRCPIRTARGGRRGPHRHVRALALRGLRARGEAAHPARHLRALGGLLRRLLPQGAARARAAAPRLRGGLRELRRAADADGARDRLRHRRAHRRPAAHVPLRRLHRVDQPDGRARAVAALRLRRRPPRRHAARRPARRRSDAAPPRRRLPAPQRATTCAARSSA